MSIELKNLKQTVNRRNRLSVELSRLKHIGYRRKQIEYWD